MIYSSLISKCTVNVSPQYNFCDTTNFYHSLGLLYCYNESTDGGGNLHTFCACTSCYSKKKNIQYIVNVMWKLLLISILHDYLNQYIWQMYVTNSIVYSTWRTE